MFISCFCHRIIALFALAPLARSLQVCFTDHGLLSNNFSKFCKNSIFIFGVALSSYFSSLENLLDFLAYFRAILRFCECLSQIPLLLQSKLFASVQLLE